MTAALSPAFGGANKLRDILHLTAPHKRMARVAVFGSFHGGYHVLSELLEPPLSEWVRVVGVATDDPRQAYTHPEVRLWKYEHTPAEEHLVRLLARANHLPVDTGRVKAPEFEETFIQNWKPDLCLMATYGQLIPRRIVEIPNMGFYNFHHSDNTWPSYPGPDPIRDMLRDGRKQVYITMHEVSEVLDGGRFVARSLPMPLPTHGDAITVHRCTWPQMGPFIRQQVGRIICAAIVDHTTVC